MTKPPSNKPRKPRTSKKVAPATPAAPERGPDPGLIERAENNAKEYLRLGLEAAGKKNWEAAIDCFRVVLRINPVDPATRYLAPYNMALSLCRLKRFDEAAGYAHAAVTANRDGHHAYNLLGIINTESGRYQDAVWYLLAAIQRTRKSKAAWLNLQAIISKHPALLTDIPYLEAAVEGARRLLESHGLLPRAH